jgi:hypothetical protein
MITQPQALSYDSALPEGRFYIYENNQTSFHKTYHKEIRIDQFTITQNLTLWGINLISNQVHNYSLVNNELNIKNNLFKTYFREIEYKGLLYNSYPLISGEGDDILLYSGDNLAQIIKTSLD